MLVAAPVSSTKTSRAGFSRSCPARQAARRSPSSGRSCSCARSDFFSASARAGPGSGASAPGCADAMARHQPGAQLVKVASGRRATSAVSPRDEPRASAPGGCAAAAPRSRRSPSAGPARLDVGHADPEPIAPPPWPAAHRRPPPAPGCADPPVALPRLPRLHTTSSAPDRKRKSRPGSPVNREQIPVRRKML